MIISARPQLQLPLDVYERTTAQPIRLQHCFGADGVGVGEQVWLLKRPCSKDVTSIQFKDVDEY